MSVACDLPIAYTGEMLTSGQIRAARALLGWKQTDLASASGVAEITIKKVETGTDARGSTLEKLRVAFRNAGVEFLAAGSASANGGPGVRLLDNTEDNKRGAS